MRRTLDELKINIDENAIVKAISTHLEQTGYRIIQNLQTTQKGVDIIAEHIESRRRLYIEAKGGTSSRPGSARFGKPYTPSQVFDRVAKGVFTSLQLREKFSDRNNIEVFLAMPNDKNFRKYIDSVKGILLEAGIGVLLVLSSGKVRKYIS